ncbi:hypothetical protein [Catellatospora sp. NPDC049609]|uniref:hypothetical protein n=1 Tax=Catellatospora sp. NPDC049609 TaxID=3155505 RepID=UPI0034459ECA
MTRLLRRVLWAVPGVLLGVLLNVTAGLLRHVPGWPGGLVGLLSGYLLVLTPAVLGLTAALRRLTAPAVGFRALPGRFQTQAAPGLYSIVVLVGYLAAPGLLSGDPWALVVVAPLVGFAFLPRFMLTPAGLDLRPFGLPAVPWAQLAAVEVLPGGWRGRQRLLRITQQPPAGRPRVESVPLWPARDSTFLVDAIRHYVAHPEHRAAIGAEAELRRLREALVTAPEGGQRA